MDDTHFYRFFSASAHDPTHVDLESVGPRFMQQMAKDLRRGPRATVDAVVDAEVERRRRFGREEVALREHRKADRITNGCGG